MKGIAFKVSATGAIAVMWIVLSIASMLGSPLLIGWNAMAMIADLWAVQPKKEPHVA
jgi:hypothetical protein